MNLPPLRGTPKQVAWAEKIRAKAFAQDFSQPSFAKLRTIDDSTWWIANRASNDKLVMTFKDPAPHQCVGGPPPPARLATHTGEYTGVAQRELPVRAGDEPETNVPCPGGDLKPGQAHPQPHDAELFAASVCRHPLLAEIAVLATLARLYKGEVAEMLKYRAKHKLEAVRETIIMEMDKDIEGLRRILK